MTNFIIGKYVPFNSFIHKLDPRGKVAGLIFLMIALFLPFESLTMNFVFLGVLLIITAILLYFSRMTISSILGSLKTMWFVVVLLLVLYSLMPVASPKLAVVFQLGDWIVYWDSFLEAAKIILRLFIMLGLTMVLTATTKPLDLTYALEWFFTPLKAIKFPAAEVAMTISIALRFIPTLLDDTERIIRAQESRGVDFAKGNIFKKVFALTSLIVPIFVSAFTRSEDLANAMECRCYDPRAKRTRYRVMTWKAGDTVCLLFATVILGFYIYASISNFNMFAMMGMSVI